MILRFMRLVAVALGIALLFWLSIEDSRESHALFFSVAICAWGGARLLVGILPDRKRFLFRHPIVGSLAGCAVVPIAMLLMVFKNGLHAHGTPDFALMQMQTVLARTPAFIVSGFLFGLGSAVWRLIRQI